MYPPIYRPKEFHKTGPLDSARIELKSSFPVCSGMMMMYLDEGLPLMGIKISQMVSHDQRLEKKKGGTMIARKNNWIGKVPLHN